MFQGEIEGVQVLFYTDRADFGQLEEEGKSPRTIAYLAIARRAENSEYILILLDDTYSVITEHTFPNVEWCRAMAEMRYPDIVWNSIS